MVFNVDWSYYRVVLIAELCCTCLIIVNLFLVVNHMFDHIKKTCNDILFSFLGGIIII